MVTAQYVIATEWTLLVIAYLLVAMRLAVRRILKQSHLLISDLWLMLACLSVLGLVICDTLTYRMGAMNNFDRSGRELEKIRFATNYFFDVGIYFPKLSMLAIYFHLIPRSNTFLRRALYLVTGYAAVSTLVTFFFDTFWCGTNIALNWSGEWNDCITFSSMTLVKINWIMCFSIEVLIFLLPLPLLYSLQKVSLREKAGLVVLFTLGLITLTVSAGRFASMIFLDNDILIYIWATTEFTVSIMVAACMALRPLARKIRTASSLSGRSKSKFSAHCNAQNSTLGSRRSLKGGREVVMRPQYDTLGSDIQLVPSQAPQPAIVKTVHIDVIEVQNSSDPLPGARAPAPHLR